MLHKNIKAIIALLMTFVFTFTFCFSNIAFASATNDGYENVEEGIYCITCRLPLYTQVLTVLLVL